MTSLNLKPYQNQNNRKVTHIFSLRPLIFNLKQEVLKLNYIYVSWNSPKTELVSSFLNLEIRNVENVSSSQQ